MVFFRRHMPIRNPSSKIKDATLEDLNYLAALIDGEGAMDIKNFQPRIIVKMKSLLPSELAEQYGGLLYVDVVKDKRSVYYSWYIQGHPLVDDFLKMVEPYSRIKSEQFRLLREALQIWYQKKPGWKEQILRIMAKLKKLHHKNPPVTAKASRLLDKKCPGWRDWLGDN